MTLKTKSIHDLRAIAQSFGITDIFSKDQNRLIQDIELKQQGMAPKVDLVPPKPEYRADLMNKPPAKIGTQDSIRELLKLHVERGLRLDFPDPETWSMSCGKKSDTGSMRTPLRVILNCANKMMQEGVRRE